jgi:hypothetical protein
LLQGSESVAENQHKMLSNKPAQNAEQLTNSLRMTEFGIDASMSSQQLHFVFKHVASNKSLLLIHSAVAYYNLTFKIQLTYRTKSINKQSSVNIYST